MALCSLEVAKVRIVAMASLMASMFLSSLLVVVSTNELGDKVEFSLMAPMVISLLQVMESTKVIVDKAEFSLMDSELSITVAENGALSSLILHELSLELVKIVDFFTRLQVEMWKDLVSHL